MEHWSKYKQVDIWPGENEEVPRQQYQEGTQSEVNVCVRAWDGRRLGQTKLKCMARR